MGGYNAILGTPRDISHEIFVDYHSRLEGILKSLDVLEDELLRLNRLSSKRVVR